MSLMKTSSVDHFPNSLISGNSACTGAVSSQFSMIDPATNIYTLTMDITCPTITCWNQEQIFRITTIFGHDKISEIFTQGVIDEQISFWIINLIDCYRF